MMLEECDFPTFDTEATEHIEKLQVGQVNAVAKLITLAEHHVSMEKETAAALNSVMEKVKTLEKSVPVLGITGTGGAGKSSESGKLAEEIVPVEVPQRKGEPIIVAEDESPRKDTSLEKLAKLRSAFGQGGTITAGNAPGVNDGAAALVLMSEERAVREGRKPENALTFSVHTA